MAEINGVPVIMAAPEGYVVDFANPHQIGATEIWCVCVAGNLLALAMMCQRFYINFFISRKFQAEDVTILLAWAASVATQAQVVELYDVQALGVHEWEMPLERYLYFSKLIYSAPITYTITVACAKATLCLFYRRINPATVFQAGVLTLLVVCVGSSVGLFFALVMACRPIAAAWNPLVPGASCLDRPCIWTVTAAIGVATDLLLFFVPMPTVLGLNVPVRQKMVLIGLFAVGSVTVVTSVVRLVMLHPTLTSEDQSYTLSNGTLWMCVESNLLVMCCCLPTVRRFLRHMMPGLFGDGSPQGASPRAPYALRTFGGGTGMGMASKRRGSHFDPVMRGQATRLADHDDNRSFVDEFRPEPFFQPTVTAIRGGKETDDVEANWLDGWGLKADGWGLKADGWGLKGDGESDEAVLNSPGGTGVEVTREVEVRSNSPTSAAAAAAAEAARSRPATRDGKRSWSLTGSKTGRSRRGTAVSRRSTLKGNAAVPEAPVEL